MERVAWCLGLLVGGFLVIGCESSVTPGEGGGGNVGGGDGGGGTTGECACANAAVTIEISDPEGITLEAGIDIEGSVRSPSPGVWEIDTCPPNADCLATIYTVRVTIPGLTPQITEGTFVSLSSADDDFEGIELHEWIEIRNLPNWGGVQNPESSGEELLLFANIGIDDGSPLPITPVPHCTDPGDDPDGVDSLRVLDLQAQADNGPDGGPFTVQAGEVQELTYVTGVDAGEYLLANVSVCDGWEWYALQYGIARVIPAKP